MSVAECARTIGVSAWWVRQRIEAGLLPAMAVSTGRRKIYKVDRTDWEALRALATGPATDPRFER